MKEAKKVGRPVGRREYKSFEVYVTPEHERTLDEARTLSKRTGRSLSAYILMAVAHFNSIVRRKVDGDADTE